MKITVFGGSGFLGSHICDKLSGAGHAVTAAAAEVAGELFLVFLDDRLDFIRHGRRTGNVA